MSIYRYPASVWRRYDKMRRFPAVNGYLEIRLRGQEFSGLMDGICRCECRMGWVVRAAEGIGCNGTVGSARTNPSIYLSSGAAHMSCLMLPVAGVGHG